MALYIDKNIYVGDTGKQLSALGDIAGKAPKSHASSGTTYGVGTTANYGHCRVINNLTTSSATNGYALQAYQGKVLSDMIKENDILRGCYPLLSVKKTSSTVNSTAKTFTCYNCKNQLIEQYPLVDGYTRKYILETTWNNNHNKGSKIYLAGAQIFEGSIWGAVDDSSQITMYTDITTRINNLGNGHADIAITNNGSGTTVVYSLKIYIYDHKN